ncbi:MAG TPA: hypothetical protein VGL23_23325 [Chloroflexota bacterium]
MRDRAARGPLDGAARVHRWTVSRRIDGPAAVDAVVALFRMQYERYRAI